MTKMAKRTLTSAILLAMIIAPAAAFGQILTLSFAGENVPLTRVEVHESVDQELLLLSEAKARVWLTLRRSARYLPIIEHALSSSGIPLDMKYVAMALTNLDPQFRSGNRRGMWRLSEADAASTGLRIDKTVDERLDPVASSTAAAKRLAALHEAFSSWTLALGAFIDQPAINAALAEAEGERDVFKLYLPEAAEKSLSQVLAGKLLYSNPGRFGYNQSKGWPVIATKRAQLEAPYGVKALAAHYKIDYKTFRSLNPHLLADQAPVGAWINIP